MGKNELITTNCKQQFPVDLQQLTDSMLTNIFRIFKCFWQCKDRPMKIV